MKKNLDARMMKWAEAGAALELQQIYAAFPRLRPQAQRPSAAAGSAPPEQKPRRRKMSRAARKRISEAQKARWAKQKR